MIPPYVAYKTFRNFLEFLKDNFPSRIDRSVWGPRYSGTSGQQLMTALKVLNLIDEKFNVDVIAAPDNLIILKKIKPPIAVLSTPRIIANIILWFVADIFNGSSKKITNGIKIKQAKYVDPVNIYKGLKLGIFLA